jgi:hypothetical protein
LLCVKCEILTAIIKLHLYWMNKCNFSTW